MRAEVSASDLGSIYSELVVLAPSAPALVLQIAAQVVASPAACSDALLLHAEAIRVWTDHVFEATGRTDTHRSMMNAAERAELHRVADFVAAHAPAHATPKEGVLISIAVAIGVDGDWNSYGRLGLEPKSALYAARRGLDLPKTYILTTRLPVPIHVATPIEADVKAAP